MRFQRVRQLMLVLAAALFLTSFASGQVRAAENLSGNLVIVTSFPQSLFEKFSVEFQKRHPDVKVFVRSKKTSAAISFIDERVNEPVDVFWASAPDAFEVLKEAGHLAPIFRRDSAAVVRVGAYPVDDPDGFYKGFAVSGYGIVWNKDYLQRYGLKVPADWRDLTDSAYARHIGISAPSRSGTTHLIVESILQSQGWAEGWATLSEIGGNLATVTARSFGVIDGVMTERFGIGAAIDFLGLSKRAMGSPVGFTYPAGTAFLPANIAIVKRTTNPEAAKAFVDFVLSKEGQMLLFEPEISRLPVMETLYDSAPDNYANPFSDELMNKGIAFDANLSRQRYQLVNSMFDVMITFRLQALRRTWKSIHEAEAELKGLDAPDMHERVQQARRLASQVPVSADQAVSSTLTSVFVRYKPGLSVPERQIELEAEWAAFVRDNQGRALKLADDVMIELRAMKEKAAK